MDPIFEHESRRSIDPPPPAPGIVDAARTSRDAAVVLAHSVADGGKVTARVLREQLEQRFSSRSAAVTRFGST